MCCEAAPNESDPAIICSTQSSGYSRTKLPNGSFKPEYYSFAEGGYAPGTPPAADRVKFLEVAHVLASSMAAQDYLPSNDPAKTDLLVLVYWGRTGKPPPGNGTPALKILRNAELSLASAAGANAPLDDYEGAVVSALIMVSIEEIPSGSANPARHFWYDDWRFSEREHYIVSEAEAPREFVALMAYDFREMWIHHRHKIRWATSFSVPGGNHDSPRELAAMAEIAAPYLGQDSKGALRKGLFPGTVTVGPVSPQN